jgi:hypothetical protein
MWAKRPTSTPPTGENKPSVGECDKNVNLIFSDCIRSPVKLATKLQSVFSLIYQFKMLISLGDNINIFGCSFKNFIILFIHHY